MENVVGIVDSNLLRWIVLFPLAGAVFNGLLNRLKNLLNIKRELGSRYLAPNTPSTRRL